MKVSNVKKVKNKYEITINEETLVIEVQTLIHFNVHKNKELTRNKLSELIKFNEKQIVYNKAIKYLAAQKSTFEFKKYLFNQEVEAKLIYELIEEFTKKGYLNDDLFTSSFIKKYQKKYALNRLELMLINKGISKELISKYLSLETNDFFSQHLEEIISKTKKTTLHKTKQTILRKMVNLGYDLNEVEAKLSNYDFKIDEEKALEKEYLKLKTRYEQKYEDWEVNHKIREALYRKGFNGALINKIFKE